MTVKSTNPVEVAKTLALAVGYFKRELKERDEKLHQYFESLLQTKLSSVQEALASIPAPSQFVLPDSVAHDANLTALRESIDFALEAKDKQINKEFVDLEKKRLQMLEEIGNKLKTGTEYTDKLHKDLLEAFAEDRKKQDAERLEDLDNVGRDIAHSRQLIHETEEKLSASDKALTEAIAANKKEGEEALAKARDTFTQAIKILDEMVNVTEENAKTALKNLSEDIGNQFKTITISVDGRFAEVIQQLESAISSVVLDMENRFKQHGTAVDGRLNAAEKKRTIADQALVKRVGDFENNISRDIAKNKADIADTNIKLGQAEERLVTAITEVDKKLPDKKDILLKKDLSSIEKDIVARIPIPKDGKNAHEWLFRPHPTKRGVMLYKREDWKEWKELVLAVNPPQDHWNAGGGGGGVPTVINQVGGHPTYTFKTVSIDTIADVETDVWLVDASAGDVSITLPVASTRANKAIWVKKINATGGDVLILPSLGGDTIEYNTDVILTGPDRVSAQFFSIGIGYVILGALV